MTKALPLPVRLAVESGISTCSFDAFHEAAEGLLGHPIWTHEFAMEETWDYLRVALAARDEGVPFRRRRRADPVTTLRELVPNKPVLTVNARTGEVRRVPEYDPREAARHG